MKKWIGLMLIFVLLTGVLAGCSRTDIQESSSAASTVTETEEVAMEADNASATKIYTDTTGREVEVPVNPQRIVTINMTAEVIALGIKPVGAADNWLTSLDDSQKDGIESVGAATSLNLEKILELAPDLIITFEKVTDEETLESLSKIAPTVIGPFFGDAMENLKIIGDLAGKTDEANAWIDEYDAKVTETKDALKSVVEEGETALVVRLSSAKSITLFPVSTWPTIYDVLGLTLPDASELSELTAGQEISLEKLTEYDPEYIFLTGAGDEQTLQYQQELTESQVWQQLTAVKNNHVYSLGSRFTTGDVLALDWALDEILRVVEETNN